MRKHYRLSALFLLFFSIFNASSLLVYGQNEVTVDRFSGTARISIPLYTVQTRGVSLPFSLHYTASGIKVGEPGRARGTGWNLVGEPKIEREVRDLPDDVIADDGAGQRRYGWLAPGRNVPAKAASLPSPGPTTACSSAEYTAYTALNDIAPFSLSGGSANDRYDAEPDVFFYSVPGHSGKFIFGGQLHIQLIPYDNVSITYTRDSDAAISSFELYTPEGHHYTFDVTDKTQEESFAQQSPSFFYRHYFNYKLNNGLRYTTAWRVSSISIPQQAGGSGNIPQATVVSFSYNLLPVTEAGSERKQLFWSGTVVPQTMYTASFSIGSHQLDQINAGNIAVKFNFENHDDVLGGPLSSIYVNALANGQNTTVEQIRLNYTLVLPTNAANRVYYDNYGTAITTSYDRERRFLTDISISNGCTPLTAYSFEYQTPSSLPPPECVEQDYWGYFNGNRAQTPVPQLYVYPQLDPATTPGGAYHLFEAPNIFGGLLLPGADRRPPQGLADFQQTTLAGTLTSIKLPTGGKISFDYEPHRFYDPLAQTYHNGAGVRVKAVHLKDNIGNVEQVRQYQYVQSSGGESSGRLLHVPRLAITSPGANNQSSQQAQWQAATITSLEDLAPDLFETRAVGYSRVIEQVVGRGQSVYLFSLAALPEDAPATGYTRTTTGLARVQNSQQQTCPTTGLYKQGDGVYPFLQATNYDQEQGNLLSVSQQTEPDANGVSQLVQGDTYQYGYLPLSTASQVRGVNYELLTATAGAYAYTSYVLKTGFIYTLLSQTHTVADKTRPNQLSTTTTRYSYNNKGQLATTVRQNSDGSYARTRLKYLMDFAGTTTSAGPLLTAVRQRVNAEKISNEPIETISEVVAGSGPKVTSVTTNTFLLEDGCTRPYQQFNWQPAQAVLTNSAAYDSTRIQNVNGLDELLVNSKTRQRPIVTYETVTQQLVATDTYSPTNRSRLAALPAADGTTVKLQVQNAKLSEILFSDFENQTTRDFTYTGALTTTGTHTGAQALNLTNSVLSHSLPESTRGNYRVSLWVQNPNGNAAYINASIDGSTVTIQSLKNTTNWQFLEIPLTLTNLSGPRVSHTLQLAPSGGSTLLVDDVMLLPTLAMATSTTYDNQYRKTSQTDANNQTLYYSYDPAGNEALVSDHNKSIIRQVTKIVAGRGPAYSVDFTVIGDLIDQNQVYLLASSSCIPNVQYTWTCVDPQTGQTVFSTGASSNPSLPYTFTCGGQPKDYQVTVTAVVQGRQLSQTRTLTVVPGPLLVQLSTCGATFYDACTGTYSYQTCDGGTPTPNDRVIFTAIVSNYSQCSSFTYNWEIAYGNAAANGNWQPLTNQGGNAYELDMPCGSQSFRVRCTVQGCNRNGVSDESGFTVNYRDASGQLCDGVPMGNVVNRPGY